MRRFGPVDHAIYVHPAESGAGLAEIHVTSNGMIEFVIDIEGKPPDSADPIQTMYVDSAISALDLGVEVYGVLAAWAGEAGARHRRPGMPPGPDNPFELLLSRFEAGAGSAAYEVPLRCRLQGTVCFPPSTTLPAVQAEFERTLDRLVEQNSWLARGHLSLEWGDNMGEAAETDLQGDLVSLGDGGHSRRDEGRAAAELRVCAERYPLPAPRLEGAGDRHRPQVRRPGHEGRVDRP